MQLNKVFIIIIAVFFINNGLAQPNPKRFYFNGGISISDNNKNVSFIPKDSFSFISLESKIELSTYIIESSKPTNRIKFKFKRNVTNCFHVRSIKTEYWNGNKIGAFEFLFEIKKEGVKMLVYFNFNDDSENDTKLEKFNINFQEGIYEVTNAKNPKLIRIKEGE